MKKLQRNLLLGFMSLALVITSMVWGQPESAKADSVPGVVCNPDGYWVCNICGENYYSSDCPHHIGEQVGTVCSPEDGWICNICNNNFATCEHHRDQEYLGTECDPYEVCDLCGRRYYNDGCPHWKGEYYGGETCEPYTVLTCNICDCDYNDSSVCCHVSGQEYEDGEVCEPYDKTICSVCGNDYYDGSVCQHHRGEVYNQVMCDTTLYCNLCGHKYYNDGCPHWDGEMYGGVTCEPYEGEICNICHNNYHNCDYCPHHVGEEYNLRTVDPTFVPTTCNICKEDYATCPHQQGTFYENMLYFISCDAFDSIDRYEAERAQMYYNLPYRNVNYTVMHSADDFNNTWNGMGNVNGKQYNIVGVVISSHGDRCELSGDKAGTDIFFNRNSYDKLDRKAAGKVVLLACSTGFDGLSMTVATTLADKVYGADVAAPQNVIIAHDMTDARSNPLLYTCEEGGCWHIYKRFDGKMNRADKDTEYTLNELLDLSY